MHGACTCIHMQVEAKKAVPKEETPAAATPSDAGAQKTRKIFVGGLAPTVDDTVLRQYFEQFGAVEDSVVMYDHDNKRPRGFGFITFAEEDSVDKVFAQGAMQNIHDKQIEIKPAVPRDQMPPARRPGMGPPGGMGMGMGPYPGGPRGPGAPFVPGRGPGGGYVGVGGWQRGLHTPLGQRPVGPPGAYGAPRDAYGMRPPPLPGIGAPGGGGYGPRSSPQAPRGFGSGGGLPYGGSAGMQPGPRFPPVSAAQSIGGRFPDPTAGAGGYGMYGLGGAGAPSGPGSGFGGAGAGMPSAAAAYALSNLQMAQQQLGGGGFGSAPGQGMPDMAKQLGAALSRDVAAASLAGSAAAFGAFPGSQRPDTFAQPDATGSFPGASSADVAAAAAAAFAAAGQEGPGPLPGAGSLGGTPDFHATFDGSFGGGGASAWPS